MSIAVWRDHTVEAYSNWGRTMVLYAVDFRSLLWTWMFLLMKPSVWFTLFEVLFMCVIHERSSDILTPIYLAAGTLSSSVPCRRYLLGRGVLSRVTWMTWHFVKCMPHRLSQSSMLMRSCWRISDSESEIIARYIAVSSAINLTRDLTWSGRSLMYARNNIDTRTKPCGYQMKPGYRLNLSRLARLPISCCLRSS